MSEGHLGGVGEEAIGPADYFTPVFADLYNDRYLRVISLAVYSCNLLGYGSYRDHHRVMFLFQSKHRMFVFLGHANITLRAECTCHWIGWEV